MGILKSIGKAIGSVASPLVSGAFGIGSALLNNKSQSDTNKTNLKIAQLNNDWSEKMMEKQHMYDLEARKYNEASNQRKRLEQAGLNPSFMMDGGSAGIAQGSSVGMPSPTTPNIQPLRYDGFANAISNTIQQSMMIAKNNADIDAIGQTQDRENALARAKIKQMAEETRNTKFRNELNDITRNLQIQNMNEDFLKKVQERSNMEEQQKLIKQQIVAQNLINQNLPEQLAMNIAVQASVRDLNRENIRLVAEDIVRQSLENAKIRYSKEELDRLREATIDALESQKWNPLANIVSGVGGAAVSAYGKKPANVYSPHNHYTSIYNK